MDQQVFISYAREDHALAESLAEFLSGEGLAIWRDTNLEPGDSYSDEIETKIEDAACVVVIWTENSVRSSWVRAEAGEALALGKLVPVLMADVRPPLEFRTIHTADLRSWPAVGPDNDLDNFLAAVRRLCGEASDPDAPAAQSGARARARSSGVRARVVSEPRRSFPVAWAVAGGALLVAAVVTTVLVVKLRPKRDDQSREQVLTTANKAITEAAPPRVEGERSCEVVDCPEGFACEGRGYCVWSGEGPARVHVPAGSAFIGCDKPPCEVNEAPRRRVELDAFAIGRYEVSASEYLACVAAGECKAIVDPPASRFDTPSSFDLPDNASLPANYINWYEAQDYCRWAGGRLCTSAEWEKAALGGCELHRDEASCAADLGQYPWGSGITCEYAAYVDNSAGFEDRGCRSYYPTPLPEGRHPLWPVDSHQKGASPYGALNMIGNVWEWTYDTVPPEPGDAEPCDPCKDTRGGGVHSPRATARGTNLNPSDPDHPTRSRWAQRGARCCWDLP